MRCIASPLLEGCVKERQFFPVGPVCGTNQSALSPILLGETGGTSVRNPDLHGPQAFGPKRVAVLLNPLCR